MSVYRQIPRTLWKAIPSFNKRISPARAKRDRGSAILEFTFTSLVWVPLVLGAGLFGVALIRAIQVAQLSRDSGHMYARGIDFSNAQNTALLTKLASSLDAQTNSKVAIVMSTVTLATQSDCDAANLKVCPNVNKYVFTNLVLYGNASYAQTSLGNPGLAWMQNGNSITVSEYLNDAALVATNFSNYMTFAQGVPGQMAYVSEVTCDAQGLNWALFSNTRSYARTFF